jgi:hypothetical protein
VTLLALPDLSALPDPNTLSELRRLPHWLGPALLVLALLITILGRHGLRLMNAALLGPGFFFAAFFGLRGVLHEWLPGAAAVLLGGIGLLVGLVLPAAGTACVLAVIFGALGYLAALSFKLVWTVPVAAAAFVGAFFGFTSQKKLSVVLPPVFAALFTAFGAQLIWRPRYPPQTKLAATAALEIALVSFALLRARYAKRRLERNARRIEDEELRRRVAEKQAEFKRVYGQDS